MVTKDSVLRERQRCVAICRRRAELWRNTTAARSSVVAAQQEARARANEAAYLADLLESGSDLPSDPELADA
jgi:hypothetical protein